MATRDELMGALRNADAAGDTEAATRFAQMISALPAEAPAAAPPAAPATPEKKPLLDRALGAYGKLSYDTLVGMGKRTKDFVDASGLATPVKSEGFIKPPEQVQTIDGPQLDQMYKEAGPGKTIGKLTTDFAMTAPISGGATVNVGSGILAKALERAVQGSTGGAVAGATLPPGEGETRAGNALQAAGIGMIGGPVIGALGDAAVAGKQFLRTGADAAFRRAQDMFENRLGPGKMASVESNVQNPAPVRMSTAAHAGSDELSAFEKTSRTTDTTGSWGRLDRRTNAEAWDKIGEAVQGRIADLQPNTDAFKNAMKPFQAQADSIKTTQLDRDLLEGSLEKLRNNSSFNASSKGQQELNRVIMAVTSPKATVGGWANTHTNLAEEFPGLNTQQLGQVRDVILSKVDSMTNSGMSKAYAARDAAQIPKEQSEAANSIYNDFSDPFAGAKGKSVDSIPVVTQTRLQNSIVKNGTDATDKTMPRDLLHPDDREQLGIVVDALRQAEHPRGVPGAGADMPGIRMDLGNPTPVGAKAWAAVRMVGNKLLNSRSEATRDAARTALLSGKGWQRMLDAANRDNAITASDAAMLADILRGVGPVSGEAANRSK